jgi:hypothetical protein
MMPHLWSPLVKQLLPQQAAEERGLAQRLQFFERLSRPRPIGFTRHNAPPIVVEQMDRLLAIWYAERHATHSL